MSGMAGGKWGRAAAVVAVVGISVVGQGIAPAEVGAKSGPAAGRSAAGGSPGDCCGGPSSWTTGDKSALGTAAGTASPVWFTVAKGVTSEVFDPRADVANMQDMQYVVTDGKSFVDLERDATDHVVSMPDEKALEYTVTNTAKNGRYRITTTYVTDSGRPTLLTRTRFQSLDGGQYQVYLLANPSMAGGAANDTAAWDGTGLTASGTEDLFGARTTVASALRASTGFVAHDNGYSGAASDCLVDLRAHQRLTNQFDSTDHGNVVQCGQVPVGQDTTFSVALGYGGDAQGAAAAADGSLASGFGNLEQAYRRGWEEYVGSLKAVPGSVAGDERQRRAYYVALMALHAAEDKAHRGASVAGLATPWGDVVNGDALNDGYHRVWGRDLYQQATGLLAAGDTAQAKRMAQFLWSSQWVSAPTQGDGTTYPAGAFPRYSPVSGVQGATPQQLGCCEQLDQDSDAIMLAWMTGLTDAATYARVKVTAEHIRTSGPATTERWEEQYGRSPSSIAAEVAGLVTAGAIARANGDPAAAQQWESTADSWRAQLDSWTRTTTGYWGGHTYYERIDKGTDPNDTGQICFDEGCFYEHDVVDFGFLDLVRLGLRAPADPEVAESLAPTAAARDGNAPMQVTTPDGDIYFHRYPHDNYGESTTACTGWPANGPQRFGRLWPVLSGERGEYELANGRSAAVYVKSMADAANDGYFIPEQVWDRADAACFGLGRPTGSAGPLMWAEGQYLRLAQNMAAGKNLETPEVVRQRYGN
ncbi:glycoside hydrolase family 15 protein [Amycolatopsis orientalis]|uniref:glycoside hydrolase family 15 protein n=1 Tax=Amycolatopsis orientalis TaxID=31958 RepID=UPI000562546E|nr:glycoside hydrolase family 15 protein [Amycolatopsis orientalis]